jgi:glycosyltransferase involved in cell wall biosynthesis
MKKVAVITRTKNRPIMLPRVLESLSCQTVKDFVWVLVNDAGEREAVDAIAAQAKDAGMDVQVIHRAKSIGMEAASNDGVKQSQSKYVVIHDDDDSWEPPFLATTIDYLDSHEEVPGVITWANRVDETLDENAVTIKNSYPYNHWLLNIYLSDLAVENRFPPISFLFRRSIYDQLGGFDETLPVLGDWDFHLRVVMQGDIHVIPKAYANYHFRINLKKGDVYGNTVSTGVDKHILYDAIYRNRKLREDIQAGRSGIGTLLALGQMMRRVNHMSDSLGRIGHITRHNRVLAFLRRLVRI